MKLFAQPYDLDATGFHFTTFEEYEAKRDALRNRHGAPVEEFEIEVIEAELIDFDLAKAWGVNQTNLKRFLDVCDEWDGHEKTVFIIAVGECGYLFDPETVTSSDFDVDIYEGMDLKDLASHFVDEGLFGDIPERIANYLDMDAIARDLRHDYTETTIGGEPLVYRCD